MIIEITPQTYSGDGNETTITTGLVLYGYNEAQKQMVINPWFQEFSKIYPLSPMVNGVIKIEKKTVATTHPSFATECSTLQKDLESWKQKLENGLTVKYEWLKLKQDIIDLQKLVDIQDHLIKKQTERIDKLVGLLRDKLGKGIFGKQDIIPKDL